MSEQREDRPLPADITPDRLLHTGSEHPVDPEDYAMATGHDPTPENIERARRILEEKGAARAVDEITE